MEADRKVRKPLKRKKSFRHEPKNGMTLCLDCHRESSELSAHGTPGKWKEWLRANAPETVARLENARM